MQNPRPAFRPHRLFHGRCRALLALLAAGSLLGGRAQGDDTVATQIERQRQAAQLVSAAAAGDETAVANCLAAGIPGDVEYAEPTTIARVQAIHYAAQGGHLGVMKRLLAAGAKIDAKTFQFGVQPIHFAAREGRMEVVEFLLDSGIKVDTADFQKQQPIHLASLGGHLEMVKFLLARGASKDAGDRKPIHFAAEGGHPEMVKYWLDSGCKADTQTPEGEQPIHAAASGGRVEILKMLVASGAKLDAETKQGAQPIIHAAAQGRAQAVQYLLDAGCQVEGSKRCWETPLMGAAGAGDLATVKVLLAAKADIKALSKHLPNDYGWKSEGKTVLHCAVEWSRKDQSETIKALLAAGADPNAVDADGHPPLYYPATYWQNQAGEAKALLDGGARVDVFPKGGDPITATACANGQCSLDLFKVLLAADADPNAVDHNGRPLLGLVVAGQALEQTEKVKALLAKGAKVNAVDKAGVPTAFYICGGNEARTDLLRLFLAEGLKVDAHDKNGVQLVHLAAYGAFGDGGLKLLLDKGAKVGAKDAAGREPLFYASGGTPNEIPEWIGALRGVNAHSMDPDNHTFMRWGTWPSVDNMQLLLAAGAKVDAISKDGDRPLLVALRKGDPKAVELLLKAGAAASQLPATCEEPLSALLKGGYRNPNGLPSLVTLLVGHGCRINAADKDGMQPIHWIARCDESALTALLEAGVKPDAANHDGWQPLHFAAREGTPEMVKKLLEAGAKADAAAKDGTQPLHLAARAGRMETVKLLLEAGAKADAQAQDGTQPLLLAARGQHVDVAKALIAAGAKVTARNKAGSFPLLEAVKNQSTTAEFINLLIADSLPKQPAGWSDADGLCPIHHAAKHGNLEAVQHLCGWKDAKTKAGLTALHLAAQGGNQEMVMLLLQRDADPLAKADDGSTPADLARRAGYLKLAELLDGRSKR